MALQITLSKIEASGFLLQITPTFGGTSSLSVKLSGVKRQITVLFSGS